MVSLNNPLRWVWDWFQKADKNKDGKMNFKEVKKLLKMMNVEMNEEHALHLFTVGGCCRWLVTNHAARNLCSHVLVLQIIPASNNPMAGVPHVNYAPKCAA